MPRRSVVLGYWQDRPPLEALDTARLADRLGFEELWIGEMATFDAFALATAIGLEAKRLRLTVGPLAVPVRTPVSIAMGTASVGGLTGGASASRSARRARSWSRNGTAGRGRTRRRSSTTAPARSRRCSPVSARTSKANRSRRAAIDCGSPRRGASSRSRAFGPKALAVAARHAARVVFNLVTPEATAKIRAALDEAVPRLGRPRARLGVWLAAAVDPAPKAIDQLRRATVAYVAAPGYREMFETAGYGSVVTLAQRRPHPKELLAAVPADLCRAVALVGNRSELEARIAATPPPVPTRPESYR
jgi:probable F420-dependent oxidoreductase